MNLRWPHELGAAEWKGQLFFPLRYSSISAIKRLRGDVALLRLHTALEICEDTLLPSHLQPRPDGSLRAAGSSEMCRLKRSSNPRVMMSIKLCVILL
ncbi:hypothetical protein KUCAC02_022290 [Chaenocephalus aceratus]|nr:hypothetical protein KUCAC02_022290 [Chaenocephalus aceratus]